ncbi:hypothetical protein VR010_05850, partial [Actinomycetaceae bacterium L2_0104]
RAGAPTPTLIRTCMGFRSCSGGTPHSRHPAEGHPQVLIIAQHADELFAQRQELDDLVADAKQYIAENPDVFLQPDAY